MRPPTIFLFLLFALIFAADAHAFTTFGHQQLTKSGVKIDRATFDDARKAVAQDLWLEIAYSKWGQEGWRKRSNLSSPEINVAAQLLRKSDSPQSLFAAAANYEATHVAARKPTNGQR